MPERVTVSSRSGKSAEVVVVVGLPQAKDRTRESEVPPRMGKAMRQMPEMTGRSELAAGESRQGSGLDEAKPPPRTPNPLPEPDQPAGTSRIRVISEVTPRRLGGPQYPVPRLT